MVIRHWEMNTISAEKSRLLSEEYGLPKLLSDILVSRGLDSPLAVEDFLNGAGELSDPFLLPDMEAAAERIREAVDSGERIAVYGDYDCDGVTATAILYQYLTTIGAEVTYYIPERDGEGYGLNRGAVEKLAADGVGLLVTVDNGISALDEISLANHLGMDVIVTDHHQPGETLPDAVAVVDPHRKDSDCEFPCLCGAEVALKLVAAMEDGNMDSAVEYFGDIAAIGTIGDVMPLRGENRLLVRQGLELLQNSENVGLNALLEIAGLSEKKLTAENIAFGIVPRINAAGRMGSANLAMELLLCEDEEHAAELAGQINTLNQERQQQEATIMADIERILTAHPEKLKKRVLVLAGEGWHHGVVGIVSARVLERFSKPNILLSCSGGEARGSARSCGEFSLFRALSACSGYLTKFGGHKQAAGMSLAVSDIDAFECAINEYAAKNFDEMPQVSLSIDCELSADMLTLENVEQLNLLEPFGAENQPPVFLLRSMKIAEIRPLSENRHIRLTLCDAGRRTVQALYFGISTERFPYATGDSVDVAVSVGINEYNGRRSVSAKVKDIRPADFEESRYFNAKTAYERLSRGEAVDPRLKRRIVPTRDELGVIYKLLRKNGGFSDDIDLLYLKLWKNGLNYCKFRVILDILDELGLICLSPLGTGITLPEEEKRVELASSGILHRLAEI